jgi:hypothetical protein
MDPTGIVENAALALDEDGHWPNFHDAEILNLEFCRGVIDPDENIWLGPSVTVTLNLCALKNPFILVLRFFDCENIVMQGFINENPIMDLQFGIEERGFMRNGEPLTPYITVNFVPVWQFALSFKCMRAAVISRYAASDFAQNH